MFQILALLALFLSNAFAQTTGTLRGQVLDADELEIPGVSITITSPSIIGGTQATVTDSLGRYQFVELLPGAYTVTAVKGGFQTVTASGVEVLINRESVQNIVMKVGEEAEVIDVVGKQTVDTESTTVGEVLSREFLRKIPTGRSYQQATQTVSGVTGGSNPNIGGSAGAVRSTPPPSPRGTMPVGPAIPQHSAPPSRHWPSQGSRSIVDNDAWRYAAHDNSSTFAIDVDTAAWTRTRWYLDRGQLPPAELVRVEEMINYFDYNLPEPEGDYPFAVDLEAGPSPFVDGRHLLRVGIQAERPSAERPPAHLVYLVDVSGSMSTRDKLPLVQRTLRALVQRLRPDDTIAIVTYAGRDCVVLRPTHVAHRHVIDQAIANLTSGGSTYGEGGLRTAYRLADQYFEDGAINRVILATDGDFNVGLTGAQLIQLIHNYRDRGIFLSTLGFGRGADAFMEQLADKGNGHYLFMDSDRAVRKALDEQLGGMLQVVAKDAKVQLHFDAEAVRAWRFIGYRNRVMADQDFANDAVDGGELGAGHNVVAYYELELHPNARGPLVHVAMRHKHPEGHQSVEHQWSLDTRQVATDTRRNTPGFLFGAAVAAFGERLAAQGNAASYDDILAVAKRSDMVGSEELIEMIGKLRPVGW